MDFILDTISSGRWLSPLLLLITAIGAVSLAATGNISWAPRPSSTATAPLTRELAKVERVDGAAVFSRTTPLLGAKLASPPLDDENAAAQDLGKLHFGDRFVEVSEPERDCLARTIYFEARGEPLDGQIAVAQTVLNRVVAGRWPRTICGVVNQGIERGEKCQFSFACWESSRRDLNGEDWNRSRLVAQDVLAERLWLKDMEEATHYHRFDVYPVWRHKLIVIRQVGAHIFYVEPGVWKPRPSRPAAPSVADAVETDESARVDTEEKAAIESRASGRLQTEAASTFVTGSVIPDAQKPAPHATRSPQSKRIVSPAAAAPSRKTRSSVDAAPSWATGTFGQ